MKWPRGMRFKKMTGGAEERKSVVTAEVGTLQL